ncbi:protein SCAR2 isoform X2 [Euphorbia lathyris]|uniref:protein SCAR2 isoform X2 n=1 Tax=Euphorbia lathyris TaxID=212925 RepID=UPI0033139D18
MPLTRYQIRNEYGLADPELYRAADKDDPEALLEGVAMAGLVGVLRQLGDLAEFAAEVFHDLHEEVMATAARGHGLMARVQQLEAEFPSIEKAFLTQTDQTPFFTNAGGEWHPNLRMEQNMITRGDLPRFVMDSYEECRGPPRLFLLDKFDVAGAGACLKRYTDPSLFKFEEVSFAVPNVEVQREKKNRRVKKGARLRNGESPEVVPTSHAKLHQLFLEERVENGHSDPARLVKLKRRQLNGFPFDPKPGKSYMEKFLGTPSPEHKVVHEVSVNPSPLRLTLNSSDESGLEIIEISTVSPVIKSSQGRESTCSSLIAEVAELKPSTPELDEQTYSREIVKVPDPISGGEADESPYIIHKMAIENELAVDEDRETEGSQDGDHSDDFMSEVDNYMDALTTMESEMETDNEYKPKNAKGLLTVGKHVVDSDANEDHLDGRADFSDSQSFGNSSMSDDGKSLFKKGRSSFSCSDSLSNLAENTPSDNEWAAKVYTSENGVSNIMGSPMDHPYQQNNSSELMCNQEDIILNAGKGSPSVPTMSLTVISTTETKLDEIPSDFTELGSKSSYTDQNGTDMPDSSVSDVPSHTVDNVNSIAEDCLGEELDHKNLDVLVSTANMSDREEEVDDGSVNKVLQTEHLDGLCEKNLVEGKIDSPQSISSPVSVNEEHQTEYADEICDKNLVETVGSPHPIISSSKEQLSSSHFPRANLDSGVTLLSENSDALKSVQINLGVDDAIAGTGINLEKLTDIVVAPELNSIEEHQYADVAVNLSQAEHELTGGATYPQENVKRLEEISRAINGDEMDVCTGKLDVEGEDSAHHEHPVNYSDKSSCEPVNLDEHVAVDAPLVAVTTYDEYGVNDASCLPSDLVCSISSDFVDIQEYLAGNEDTHQNGMDYKERVLAEYFMAPEEKKEVKQLEFVPTELKSSTHESTSDGTLSPGLRHHIHESALTYEAESCSYFSDVTAVPSSEHRNQEMESKLAYSSKDPCDDAVSSPTCCLPDMETSMEHAVELQADKSFAEPALVALDESNSESLKLQYSHSCQISDSRTPAESLELQSDEHDFIDGSSSQSLDLQSNRTQIVSDMGQERCIDASSKPEALPSQEHLVSSAGQELSGIGLSRNPFDSVFPSFGLLPENSEEVPPLPPLPPMQWRMGKFQPPSLASQGQWTDHGKCGFLPVQPFIADEKYQSDFLLEGREIADPSNPFLSITKDIQKSQHLSVESQDNSIQPTPLSLGLPTSVTDESQRVFLPLEGMQSLNPSLNIPIATSEWQEDGYVAAGGDPLKSSLDTSSTVAIVVDEPTDTVPLHGSQTKLLNHVIPESTSEPKKPENSLQSSAVEEQNYLEKPVFPPTTLEGQHHHDLATLHGQTTWSPSSLVLPPTNEVGKSNGSKLPRPRNPLIDAVAAHDKSKLRKVTERVHPQLGPKAEERDTLLEQIRTKSFNLKPTAVTRPSIQGIQGPKTNLKVAAILEKANAIRQALTGSDEDEDTDSWSDS